MILEQVLEEYLPAISFNVGHDSVNISGGPCDNSLTRDYFNLSGNGPALMNLFGGKNNLSNNLSNVLSEDINSSLEDATHTAAIQKHI